MRRKEGILLFICALFIHRLNGDDVVTQSSVDVSSTPTSTQKTSTELPATTITPQQACSNASGSCEDCVKITQCYYCTSTKICAFYPYNHIFPKPKECDMGDVRWAVCWFNFKAMVISMGVLAGLLIISCTICICCCCRKKKKNTRLIQENAKREREREERRIRSQDRQKERETKYNEIRRKYGLMKDDAHPYQRFEA